MSENETVGVLRVPCADCGREYPVGGRVSGDNPERPDHHAEGCPVRLALEAR